MTARQPHSRGSTRVALAALLGFFLATTAATAQDALPGDVNRDGEINILDVQGSINIALGAGDAVPEADVDASATVDVRDVQTIINTALGIGGLVQPVEGQIDLLGDIVPAIVAAVSSDGRTVRANIDRETGVFHLVLDVGATWSIGFLNSDGGALATIRFPAEQYPSATLPLLQLATGAVIDLGVLPPTGEILAGFDLRTLLGQSAERLDIGDYDGNGLPDVVDELIFPLPVSVPIAGFDVPTEVIEAALVELLKPCVEEEWAEPPAPTLVGAETNGIPNFVAPLLECIEYSLRDVLSEDGLGIPGFVIEPYLDYVMETLREELPDWLDELDRLDLRDNNGNFLPDYIEQALCVAGLFGPCTLDVNGNTVADFLEDQDQDGIANLFDPDYATAQDLDGDGVANDVDLDDDGDGIPDYADAEPTDPNVA